ncbi:hypothetical protein CFIMG_004059RA [Ceratocystis fimbriata CBS 114723]|uniref:Outer spore wall protein RRT8 n=1 Tax=Ceratocystis fimbriata CBS 114723 TaxID=1035309 RepID=A0A2C5WWU0_9PEZI|nr:hypothetical protein CFIMG_004059RA [Ceratocystis fimbriata CBS 114723]
MSATDVSSAPQPVPPNLNSDAPENKKPGFRRRMVNGASTRITQIVKDDVNSTVDAIQQSKESGSWLYPLKGVIYFAFHKSLWSPFVRNLPSLMLVSSVVLAFTFSVVWVPTMAVAFFLTGPLAMISATISTLALSATIIHSIAMTYILPMSLVDVFDATLVLQGHMDLVNAGRQVKPALRGDGQNVLDRMGAVWKWPLRAFSLDAAFRKLVYIPLNMIPIAGPARTGGGECHDRYFQLKGWRDKYTNAFVRANSGSYAMFALVDNLLSIIPFASIMFRYTTTVGAALWAADIEEKRVRMVLPEIDVD